jgi:NAD(P)-dependent dehydrogenase (short-subunit alcohol dehydrogenase family)
MTTQDMLNRTFSLAGHHAIVTGAAAGGLGEHMARALAGAGARVALVDLPGREQEVRAVAADLPVVEGEHLWNVRAVRWTSGRERSNCSLSTTRTDRRVLHPFRGGQRSRSRLLTGLAATVSA